jgi:hypothetical protein
MSIVSYHVPKEGTMSIFKKLQLAMGTAAVVSSVLYFWLGYAEEPNTEVQMYAFFAAGLILFVTGVFMVADVLGD